MKNSYSEPYRQQKGNDKVTLASPVTSLKDKAARKKRVFFPPKGRTETVLSSESEQPRMNLGIGKGRKSKCWRNVLGVRGEEGGGEERCLSPYVV